MVFNKTFNPWEEIHDLFNILQNLLIIAKDLCQDWKIYSSHNISFLGYIILALLINHDLR